MGIDVKGVQGSDQRVSVTGSWVRCCGQSSREGWGRSALVSGGVGFHMLTLRFPEAPAWQEGWRRNAASSWCPLTTLGPLSPHLVRCCSVLPPWIPRPSHQPRCIAHSSDVNFAFSAVRRCPGPLPCLQGEGLSPLPLARTSQLRSVLYIGVLGQTLLWEELGAFNSGKAST